MGVLTALLAGQNIPAPMGRGVLESLGGHLGFAQNKLHLREIGAVVNLPTSQAARMVSDVADFAREMPHPPPNVRMPGMMSPRTVNNFGQSALPGTASGNSSHGVPIHLKCIPHGFHFW